MVTKVVVKIFSDTGRLLHSIDFFAEGSRSDATMIEGVSNGLNRAYGYGCMPSQPINVRKTPK